MESGRLYARITQMREAANTIRHSANRITDSIDAVDHEIRALTVDQFTSAAAEDFRSRYLRMAPRLREASQRLLEFYEKLTNSADEIEVASRPTE